MEPRSSLKSLKRTAALTIAAALIGVSTAVSAGVYQFFTPSGATLEGKPVSASATFTTSLNQVTLTLTNLIANPISVIQALSDISFRAGGVTTGTGLVSPTAATYINIGAGGVVTPGACCAIWGLSNTGGTYHLDALVGQGAGGTGPADLIIGPGPYTNANGSIARNRPHNPFINTTATFTLALAGVTAGTVITNIVFSFGTDGATVATVPVPIPDAIWLFASGLLGLIVIARRKYASTLHAASALA